MLTNISNIVIEVGNLISNWQQENIFEGYWENDVQVKAKVDVMANDEIEERLKSFTPQIPIISEENLNSLVCQRPQKYWLIDPIDGTASFVKGFSGYVTQIALIENNIPVLAAVFAPALNQLYTAKKGKGSYLNEQKIQVNKSENFYTLIDNYPAPKGITKKLYEKFNFQSYLECGSISLKICRVADGSADLFFKDVPIRDWDLGAPQLILEEAGGILTSAYGHKFEYKGSYEHNGLIATVSEQLNKEIISWYKNFKENPDE